MSRTGQERASHAHDRSIGEGVLPSGAMSICISTDGSDGCRVDGEPVEQSKIWWECNSEGKLYFVTTPHGCGKCFRPVMREGDVWRRLSKKEVPQTSAPTANGWIKARKTAATSCFRY